MPRETYNIENFVKGIICATDVEDIPDNACVWSQDLETQSDEGALLGRKAESNMIAGTGATFHAHSTAGGVIDTVTIDNAGTGYGNAVKVPLTITSATGSGAVAYATSAAGGTIASTTIVSGGTGYGVSATVVCTVGYAMGAVNAAMIDVDGTKFDLIYHERVDNKIRRVVDFHSVNAGDTDTQATVVSGDTVNFHVHNKEVRIARRSSADVIATPQWAGYIDFTQFAGSVPGFKVADTTLSAKAAVTRNGVVDAAEGVTIPPFYKAISISVGGVPTVFGVPWGGTEVYEVIVATGVFTIHGGFHCIQGLCADGTDLWIYEAQGGMGALYKYDAATFTEQIVCPIYLDSMPLNRRGTISDIAITTNGGGTIWFGALYPTGGIVQEGETSYLLYRCAKPTTNVVIEPISVNRTLPLTGQMAQNADLLLAHRPIYTTYRNLVVLSATQIGYVCSFNPLATRFGASEIPAITDGLGYIFVAADDAVAESMYGIIRLLHQPGEGKDFDGIYYDASGKNFFFTTNGKVYREALSSIPIEDSIVETTAGANSLGETVVGSKTQVTGAVGSLVLLTRTVSRAGLDTCTFTPNGVANYLAGANAGVTALPSAIGDAFKSNTTIFYRTNFTFDGSQDSPLNPGVVTDPIYENSVNLGSRTVTLTITDVTKLSPRVSAMNVWHAWGPLGSTEPTTAYRMFATRTLSDTEWKVTGNEARIDVVDSDPDFGVPFENQTGISSTVETFSIKHALMADINNQLFIARCSLTEIPDASHYIFRSKTGRYDMFDWSIDFLCLPTVPTAIHAHAGRIWVFDAANCYKINPDNLSIEDTYYGYGVPDQKAVCQSEWGMVVASKAKNIWLHDGREFQPIGNAIRIAANTTCAPWEYAGGYVTGTWTVGHTNFTPIVKYSSLLRAIIITVSRSATLVTSYIYTPERGRWDYWLMVPDVAGTPTATGTFTGKDGELYYSMTTGLYKVCGSATRTVAWRWYSRDIGMGDNTQYKKVYKILLSQNNTVVPAVDLANNQTFTALTSYTLPGANWKRKITQFQLPGAAANDEVYSCSIVFRHLKGKR